MTYNILRPVFGADAAGYNVHYETVITTHDADRADTLARIIENTNHLPAGSAKIEATGPDAWDKGE